MFRKWKKGGHLDPQREKIKNELFTFKKTVEHGFPHHPCAFAYDPILKLMAIGTKTGAVKIFGAPGVEFTGIHSDINQVLQLHFVPGEGRIISILDDNTIHMWELCSVKDEKQGAQGLVEVGASQLSGRPGTNQITVVTIQTGNKLMWIGTEGGGIYTLTLPEFEMRETIHQDQVMQSIPDHYKTGKALGLVEAIAEHPSNPSQILIGYNRGLIVLWDDSSQSVESFYLSEKGLESISWLSNSKEFMTAHTDGYLCTWRLESSSPHTSYIPYGPFPCKAITKILWKSSRTDHYRIFSGGMPRANYGDRHCVSVIHGSKHVTFDFTSRVIDFFVVSKHKPDADWEEPEFLIILLEEELVAIDLTQEEWPSMTPPYLGSPHASAITCSAHTEDIPVAVWDKIMIAAKSLQAGKSNSPWPITGGRDVNPKPNTTHDVLLTGHEDGSVKLWDVSNVSMQPILKVQTSQVFVTDSDGANDDGDGFEEQFPPFRKVGEFDPYSDDPRLAIRKVAMCPTSGTLIAGGTAGQVVVFILSTDGMETQISSNLVDILEGRTDFSWKGHGQLQTKENHIVMPPGYQIGTVIQCQPPASITALSICSNWGLIGLGTGHGFALFDYLQNKSVLSRCTLEAGDHVAMEGHFSRMKSIKMSLRQSMRRIRGSFHGGGRGSVRRRASGRRRYKRDMSQKLQEANAALVDEEETASGSGWSPAATGQRRVEARSAEDGMTGMVRCTYFATTYVRDTVSSSPTFWAGTNSGGVYVFSLHVPDYNQRQDHDVTTVVGKHIQLMHRAPVVDIAVLDGYGTPVHALHNPADGKPSNGSAIGKTSPNAGTHHTLVICSEEQVKVFALPKVAAKRKFKLTALDGSLIRRAEYAKFVSSRNPDYNEYGLVCLTNIGEILIFGQLPSIRPQETYACIARDDAHGISTTLLTTHAQGMYLLSQSEYVRFTLSASSTVEPVCRVQTTRSTGTDEVDGILNEMAVQVVVEDNVPNKQELTTPKKSSTKNSRSGGAAVVATQPSSPKTPLLCDHDDTDDDDDTRHVEKHESVLEEAERTLAEAGDSIQLSNSEEEEINVQDLLGAIADAERQLKNSDEE
uniref:Lethal(2) giant larvae protein homolog 1 n=1 Tax=Phallusia mammillata TaxID=59560 RepID=A0A6F9DKD6_9ASCI|nr:lethal(2) giant larvae protein homolog 1 [Phallusia mammillata]